ncbi:MULTISPECIES: DUF4307 domain-containing protein [Actinomadura]|uniref:DUF4307 domain-containing protein n=1 Tax=Actinomadura yumaensis TaxID=111807 RepID=A0ABW2CBD6_9ACTN|nr:DUF4307 domain-containing protein [Actinomadura sp. J1-007]MWK33948.1 DUF4307 domain-containing protein [Actinomadura sp. J1-007]
MATSVPAPPITEKRRGRLGYIVIGLVAAVCAGGFAFVFAHVGQTPGIAAQTIAYEVLNDTSVKVSYSVAKAGDDTVRCTVDAYDTDLVVLAQHDVTLPAGSSKMSRTDTLQTPKRATGARVRDCRKV